MQCRSRTTSAVHRVVVTRRRSRPRSRTSPWVPRTAGMTSASQASRRSTSGGRSVPSAVVPTRSDAGGSRSFLRVSWSRVTRSRAGVPWVSGGSSVSRACWAVVDEGVPQAGAVVAGVAVLLPGLRVLWSVWVGGGVGAGQRQQGGEEEGAVLGRAAAPDPDSAGPVGADREVAGQVGGAFLPLRAGFEPAVDGVGVDHRGQVPSRPGELGGIQARRLAEQDLLPPAADQVTGGQVLDGPDDDVGLSRATRSRRPDPAWSGPGVRSAPRARTTRRLPSPRRSPPVWVSQSPVDP